MIRDYCLDFPYRQHPVLIPANNFFWWVTAGRLGELELEDTADYSSSELHREISRAELNRRASL